MEKYNVPKHVGLGGKSFFFLFNMLNYVSYLISVGVLYRASNMLSVDILRVETHGPLYWAPLVFTGVSQS